MIIGERIKEARKNKNMTQQELGEKLGVSKVSVCGYEKGVRIPTIENFTQLLDVLDVSSDYLLGREFSVVCEDEESYNISLAKEDIEILKEIKKYPTLYNGLIANPKRTVQLIERRMKK